MRTSIHPRQFRSIWHLVHLTESILRNQKHPPPHRYLRILHKRHTKNCIKKLSAQWFIPSRNKENKWEMFVNKLYSNFCWIVAHSFSLFNNSNKLLVGISVRRICRSLSRCLVWTFKRILKINGSLSILIYAWKKRYKLHRG